MLWKFFKYNIWNVKFIFEQKQHIHIIYIFICKLWYINIIFRLQYLSFIMHIFLHLLFQFW